MITRLDVGMDSRLSVQQLDENPVAGRKGSLELRRYYKRYREIAKDKGISFVGESKPEKAFPPSMVVEVLGITYYLEAWIWNMDERRWSILVRQPAWAEKDRKVNEGSRDTHGKVKVLLRTYPQGSEV